MSVADGHRIVDVQVDQYVRKGASAFYSQDGHFRGDQMLFCDQREIVQCPLDRSQYHQGIGSLINL